MDVKRYLMGTARGSPPSPVKGASQGTSDIASFHPSPSGTSLGVIQADGTPLGPVKPIVDHIEVSTEDKLTLLQA